MNPTGTTSEGRLFVVTEFRGVLSHLISYMFCFKCDLMTGSNISVLLVMGAHLTKHGDGVKDIAFDVENCVELFKVRKTVLQLLKRRKSPVK